MRILITGGAGFIGRSLHDTLTNLGHTVFLLDIKAQSFELNDLATYINQDICDGTELAKIFNTYKFDGVIHLAAVSRVIDAQKNPERCRWVNVDGTKLLLQTIETAEQNLWLIFGSSREVYGEPAVLPVKESLAKNPINIYGETKLQGEELFFEFSQKYELNCAILRFSNVYGNAYDIPKRVTPLFCESILAERLIVIEGGEQLIDFTHIDDTVAAVLNAMHYLQHSSNIQNDFHICPGIGWTLWQLIQFIEQTIGRKATIKINKKRDYDVVKFVGDNKKASEILGLTQLTPLDVGLHKYVSAHYKSPIDAL